MANHNTHPPESASPSNKKRNFDETDEVHLLKAMVFCDKAAKHVDHMQLLRILYDYGFHSIDKSDMRKRIAQLLENHPQLIREFDDLIVYYTTGEKTKKKKKNIIITPSYILRSPDDSVFHQNNSKESKTPNIKHEKISFKCEDQRKKYYRYQEWKSSRKLLSIEGVLNNEHVSKAPDTIFKHKEPNKYEKILLQCEDERYEFDMELNRLESTFKRLKDLVKRRTESRPESREVKDYFTIHQLICIEQVFGVDFWDSLAAKPYKKLRKAYRRLKEKIDELKVEYEGNLKEKWAKIFADNYNKASHSEKFRINLV